MGLNRDKFRKIVGGITTPEPVEAIAAESAQPAQPVAEAESAAAVEQGGRIAGQAPLGRNPPLCHAWPA